MIPLKTIGNVVNRWMGTRATARRGRRSRRRWAVESLEVRTLLTMPVYVQQTGTANPMNGVTGLVDARPVLADLNGDGALDLIVGRANGISYFENDGDASSPDFTERTGAENPFENLSLPSSPAPALGDWNGDGLLDLLVASSSGLTAFVNVGTAAAPAFDLLEGGLPFGSPGYSNAAIFPVPAFGDMDRDGDLDLVVSRSSFQMAYYQNTGTAESPLFQSGLSGNPFTMSLGVFGAPALGDVDGDGDIDLVTGSQPINGIPPAVMKFYENTGSATNPLASVADVFQGQFSETTFMAAPALGDLDGDGDQDMLIALAGEQSGEIFQYFRAEPNRVDFKPVNTVPGFQLAHEDVALVFSVAGGNAISVGDPNADGSDLQVTLSASAGQLTLATTAGLDFAFADSFGTGAGDGIDDATMRFRGTLAEINAALDGLAFLPTVNFAGSATLTIVTNDLGQPGGEAAMTDTDSIPIFVLSVATQVEQLQLEITLLVEFSGLNQGPANALLRLLNLMDRPNAEAHLGTFMRLVGVFGNAGLLTESDEVFLLERAEDILAGITTSAN